jgi:hypothetical protein
MEPEAEPQEDRLDRFLTRLRKAPAKKRQVYAIGAAAFVTGVFVIAVMTWRLVTSAGDDVPLSASLGETFSQMEAAFTSQK